MNYPVDSVIHLSNLAGVLVVINDYVSIVYFVLFFFPQDTKVHFKGFVLLINTHLFFFLMEVKVSVATLTSSDESHSKRVHLACQMAKSSSIDFL